MIVVYVTDVWVVGVYVIDVCVIGVRMFEGRNFVPFEQIFMSFEHLPVALRRKPILS